MTTQTLPLRSRAWFDNPQNPDMNALYLERHTNWGLSLDELQSGKPIIGIAQTGSDLSPCNCHHLTLETRERDGIIAAGGIPISFPIHPIQESGKRLTAALDRNLSDLSLVAVLCGDPIDGVVLLIGRDTTTPACLMGAATANVPAIAQPVGPLLNGWHDGECTGSGTISIAQALGVELSPQDREDHGHDLPLLINLQPAGADRGEDYHHAGGVPGVVRLLMEKGRIRENAITAKGCSTGVNCRDATVAQPDVIRTTDTALAAQAGFRVLSGNMFDSAIIKTSLISADFRARYLSDPADPEAAGGYPVPKDQTPWQQVYRDSVLQLQDGAGMRGAERFRQAAQRHGVPRDSH